MTNVTTSTVFRVNPANGEIEMISENKPTPRLHNMHGGSNLIETISVIDGKMVWMAVIHTANTYRNHLIELEYNQPHVSEMLLKYYD
jgi:hypothetical protein